jgi:predicted RNA-binding protein with PIN domain
LITDSNSLFFIDAYNLMYSMSGIDYLLSTDHSAARTLFYREFDRLTTLNVNQLRIVIDGARLPDEECSAGISTVWVDSPEKADERIIKLLMREARRSKAHRSIIVVTNDRDLAARSRARGAEVMACAEFIRRFLAPVENHPGQTQSSRSGSGRIRKSGGITSKKELEWWLNEMGAEKDPDHKEPAHEPVDPATPIIAKPTEEDSGAEPDKKPAKSRDDLARLLGLDPDDPRIYRDDDEF